MKLGKVEGRKELSKNNTSFLIKYCIFLVVTWYPFVTIIIHIKCSLAILPTKLSIHYDDDDDLTYFYQTIYAAAHRHCRRRQVFLGEHDTSWQDMIYAIHVGFKWITFHNTMALLNESHTDDKRETPKVPSSGVHILHSGWRFLIHKGTIVRVVYHLGIKSLSSFLNHMKI